MVNNAAQKAIDQIDRHEKSFIPKLKGHGCMSKKREANFYYVTMFSFGRAVLLVSMRT